MAVRCEDIEVYDQVQLDACPPFYNLEHLRTAFNLSSHHQFTSSCGGLLMIEDTSSCFNEENTKPKARTVTPNYERMIHKIHKLSNGIVSKISQLVGFLFP